HDAVHQSHILADVGDGFRGSWGSRPWHKGPPPPDAKWSHTEVRWLERFGQKATLVECRLRTGRQHQIRIHLSEAGHPLIGEKVYVRGHLGPLIEAPRVMLHARLLGFEHPRTGRWMEFELEAPGDFRRTIESLRAEAGSFLREKPKNKLKANDESARPC
ncbi:MAG: pseudouridine synthase, partial [Deltaproteobacteria bacterium]|nr:pseudouridine synthase [Deltaproteobacteria bacterium]